MEFIRYGNLIPQQHDRPSNENDWTFHTPPCEYGFYAFPKGFVEMYLLGGIGSGNVLNGRFKFLKDENGNKITVRISVEYCENSGKGSTMFFGKSAENINGGAWKTELRPRLPKKLEEYYKIYELEIRHMGFSFILQLLSDNENVLYEFENLALSTNPDKKIET